MNRFKAKYLIKTAILTIFLSFVLYWLFFTPVAEVKQIPEEIKTKISLPDNNEVISLVVEKGQIKNQFEVDNYDQEKQVYYSIANLGRRVIKPQVVINGQDWFTDRSILDYALKEIDRQKASNEEVVVALLEFVVNNRYHFNPSLEDTYYYFLDSPVQYFNSWGYGFCDNSALTLVQFLYLAGFEAREVNIKDHVVSEVFYDEVWHMLDSDREVYYRNFKGKIASIEEIVNNNQLLDSPIWLKETGVDAVKKTQKLQVIAFSEKAKRHYPAEMFVENKDYQNELIYRLRPNEEIRFYYNFMDKYYWGWKSNQPPEFTNGVLISGNKGGFYKFDLSFPIVASYIYKPNLCKAINKTRFSLNGIRWKKITDCQDDVLNLTDLFPIGEGSYPTRKYFLTLPWSLTDYQVLTQFQTAPRSIPKLKSGVNDVEIKKSLKSDIEIEFGYLYNEPRFLESGFKDD